MPSRQSYCEAAGEHLAAADSSHAGGSYATAHYLYGLAVECILYAHGADFDRRHNLQRQYRSSNYDDIVPDDQKQDIATALSEVQLRWLSSDRYEGPRSLVKQLNARRVSYNVRGSKLKENSAQLGNAARTLVELGVKSWS